VDCKIELRIFQRSQKRIKLLTKNEHSSANAAKCQHTEYFDHMEETNKQTSWGDHHFGRLGWKKGTDF